MEKYCGNCFQETLDDRGVCQACGFDGAGNREKHPLALPAGSILNGRYIIGKVLGQGGFGITYMAKDHQTGQTVAVKEFFPDAMATRTGHTTVTPLTGEKGENFSYGKNTFLLEAKTMAEFIGNPNIVRVYSYFEENGTGYFVMEYVDGRSFQDLLKANFGRVSWEEAMAVLLPVMDALAAVHEKGIIHRDIAPDNICIAKDGTVKLLDFGAARYSLGNVSQSLDVVLRHGFAPKEQYKRHGRQGPYTDIYALGATLYYAITGSRPDDAIERLDEDTLPLPSTLGANVEPWQEDVIFRAMAIQPEDRYRSVAEFKAALTDHAPRPAPKPVPKPEPKPAPAAKPDPKPEPAPVPAPKAKLPKWLIPAGAAAVLMLGVLLGTALGGEKGTKEQATLAVKVPAAETVQTKQPSGAEVSKQETARDVYLLADLSEDLPYEDTTAKENFWGQSRYARNEVKTVRFVDSLQDAPEYAWDVSAAGDRSILAWFHGGDVTVAANGRIRWNPNASKMFFYFTELESIDFGNCVETTGVTDMRHLFWKCGSLKALDVSFFDTSAVTYMTGIFSGCSSLTELDVSSFDVSSVKGMNAMFNECSSLTELDVSGFNTSGVEDMSMMFANCDALKYLNLSSLDTSGAKTLHAMFSGSGFLRELDLSGFSTSNVEDMSFMFSSCKNLQNLNLSGLDTANVKNMKWMFHDCKALTELNLSDLDTRSVENMEGMFYGCSNLADLNCSDQAILREYDSR